MGSGSDVAREAAKLVLLTDNFSSVVYGIEQVIHAPKWVGTQFHICIRVVSFMTI